MNLDTQKIYSKLDRAHKIVSLKERSNFVGKAKILDTLWVESQSLSSVCKTWCFFQRNGINQTTKEGINVVESDFMLATAADIVADSAQMLSLMALWKVRIG